MPGSHGEAPVQVIVNLPADALGRQPEMGRGFGPLRSRVRQCGFGDSQTPVWPSLRQAGCLWSKPVHGRIENTSLSLSDILPDKLINLPKRTQQANHFSDFLIMSADIHFSLSGINAEPSACYHSNTALISYLLCVCLKTLWVCEHEEADQAWKKNKW